MQEFLLKFLDFVHSTLFLYIVVACWALNVGMIKKENTNLRKRCDTLQAENAKFQKCHNISTSVNNSED